MPARLRQPGAGVAAALLLALPRPVAAAAASAPPEILVAQVYHRLIAAERGSRDYDPPETFYTPRLKALAAASRRQAPGGVGCGLDFVFWVDGQDERLTDLAVTRGPTAPPDRTTVTATFTNLGAREKIVFDFRRLGGRWLLDDARSVEGDNRWTYCRLLQCKD